jgi:hypothetical protein
MYISSVQLTFPLGKRLLVDTVTHFVFKSGGKLCPPFIDKCGIALPLGNKFKFKFKFKFTEK